MGRAPLPKPFTLSCALTESPTPPPLPKRTGRGEPQAWTRILQFVDRPAVAFLTVRTPRERGPATIPPRDGRHSRIFQEAIGGGFEAHRRRGAFPAGWLSCVAFYREGK